MDTVTNFLIGACIVLVVFIIIILILYFRTTPNIHIKQSKKRNEADDEIENELKKNTK